MTNFGANAEALELWIGALLRVIFRAGMQSAEKVR